MIALPRIATKRLILRPLRLKDAKDIFEYACLDAVGPSAGWPPHRSLRDTRAFIRQSQAKRRREQPGVFAVVLKETGRVVGTIEIHSYVTAFKGEIGMVLHPELWGQGLMVEAGEVVMVYAFETLKLKRLVYAHFPGNRPSRRLREKLGFTYEGVARNGFKRYDGILLDEVISSFTDGDYFTRDADRFLTVKQNARFSY